LPTVYLLKILATPLYMSIIFSSILGIGGLSGATVPVNLFHQIHQNHQYTFGTSSTPRKS
jgi:hypothetical protein